MAHNRIIILVAPMAFGIGWMLSPESFLLLGNAAGQLKYTVVAALILSAAAHLVYFGSESDGQPSPGNTAEFILETGAYLSLAIAAGTLILASAGYAFNEIFAVWFPNLLFSFCLLAIILAANLAGPKVSDILQIVLIGIVIISFFLLLAMGLTGSPEAVANNSTGKIESPAPWRYAFWLAVLFLGPGLASGLRDEKTGRLVTAGIIIAMAIFFVAWSLVSLKWVAPHRLSNLAIPHILAARAIGGDFGRMLMGLVVVCGGAAGVNLLVRGTSRKLADAASRGYLPRFFRIRSEAPPVPLILVSGGIAAMMGLGMAGEPITEVYMRGGLVMWLALMAYRSFSGPGSKRSILGTLLSLYPGFVFLGSVVVFLKTYPHVTELLEFSAIVIMALALWAVSERFFKNQNKNGPTVARG